MIAAYGEAIRTLVRLTPWLIAWAWRTGVRGHPWRTAAIVAFLLLFIVPIEPFRPICSLSYRNEDTLGGPFTAEYRRWIESGFAGFGVAYIDVGGFILLRLIPWLDGIQYVNYHNARLNAERKTAWRLVDIYFVGRRVDEDIYRDPSRKRDIRRPRSDYYKYPSCEFMRAVVYGHGAMRFGRGIW